MIELNKVDKEIIEILKATFVQKVGHPMESDYNTRIWMVRSFFSVSLLCLATRIFLVITGDEVPAEISFFLSMPIAFFFGILFMHINNESENTSIIIFALTWISILIGLYV